MFVESVQNNGNTYLRLVKSVRVKNKDGLKVSSKQVVLNIGPLSRFDDGQPDYVERLKKSFKAGNPLIPSLLPYCTGDNKPEIGIAIVLNRFYEHVDSPFYRRRTY